MILILKLKVVLSQFFRPDPSPVILSIIMAAINGPKAPSIVVIVLKFSGKTALPRAHIGQLIRQVSTK
jgi:hypothetical protein